MRRRHLPGALGPAGGPAGPCRPSMLVDPAALPPPSSEPLASVRPCRLSPELPGVSWRAPAPARRGAEPGRVPSNAALPFSPVLLSPEVPSCGPSCMRAPPLSSAGPARVPTKCSCSCAVRSGSACRCPGVSDALRWAPHACELVTLLCSPLLRIPECTGISACTGTRSSVAFVIPQGIAASAAPADAPSSATRCAGGACPQYLHTLPSHLLGLFSWGRHSAIILALCTMRATASVRTNTGFTTKHQASGAAKLHAKALCGCSRCAS